MTDPRISNSIFHLIFLLLLYDSDQFLLQNSECFFFVKSLGEVFHQQQGGISPLFLKLF